MNQPFSWNEAAKEALHEAYKRGHKCAAAGYVSKDDENHAVAEALQSLNQAFKQAVDAAIGEDEVDVAAGKYADREASVRDKLRAEQWKRAKAFIGSKHSGRES